MRLRVGAEDGVYIPQAHSEVPLAQQVEALIVMVIVGWFGGIAGVAEVEVIV